MRLTFTDCTHSLHSLQSGNHRNLTSIVPTSLVASHLHGVWVSVLPFSTCQVLTTHSLQGRYNPEFLWNTNWQEQASLSSAISHRASLQCMTETLDMNARFRNAEAYHASAVR